MFVLVQRLHTSECPIDCDVYTSEPPIDWRVVLSNTLPRNEAIKISIKFSFYKFHEIHQLSSDLFY